MHDSFLIEKIYQAALTLCEKNSISKVLEISLLVSVSSHIEPEHLLSHLIERDNRLFGDWTEVIVEKSANVEELQAVVNTLCGESYE